MKIIAHTDHLTDFIKIVILFRPKKKLNISRDYHGTLSSTKAQNLKSCLWIIKK